MKKLFIVGSGFFGAVVAERITAMYDAEVIVIDRRDHPGGNCYSEIDVETGVEYHKYGSHIFHTSDERVWNYINRFGAFNEYRHRVYTSFNGEIFSMPINLDTINSYYRKALTPEEAKEFIAQEIKKENILTPQNLEEKAISLIGRPLYEAFVRGYTLKQWEKDPQELSPDIITRLPVRYNYNNRYFSDRFEGIPVDGYGKMLQKMFSSPKIKLLLNTTYKDIKTEISGQDIVLYTGAADEFFDYKFGALEWRTVDFQVEKFDYTDYQGTSVMNYAGEKVPFTRIHEFKHYHPERQDTGKTIIFKEFSRFASPGDEPYYPVFTEKNQQLHKKYIEFAKKETPNVVFGGRLGLYRYLDMDDTIAEALACYENTIVPMLNS